MISSILISSGVRSNSICAHYKLLFWSLLVSSLILSAELFLDIIPWYYCLILFLKLRLTVFLEQSLISSHFSESILKQYYCYHLISSSLIKHQFIIRTDWIGTHTWRYQDRWNHALRTTIRVVHLTCSTGSRGISQE